MVENEMDAYDHIRQEIAAVLCACHFTDGFCTSRNKPDCKCNKLAAEAAHAIKFRERFTRPEIAELAALKEDYEVKDTLFRDVCMKSIQLRAELARLKAAPSDTEIQDAVIGIFNQIAHGDDEHKRWLFGNLKAPVTDAITAFLKARQS